MRKQSLILSTAIAAVAGYAGFLQWRNAQLSARIDELEARSPASVVSDVEHSGAATTDEAANDAADADAVSQSAVAASGPNPQDGSRQDWNDRRRDRAQRMAEMFDDRERRADMIEQRMSRLDESYAAFFRTLKLSPDQIESLKTILAQQGIVDWESRMRTFAAETDEAKAEVAANMAQQKAILDAEIEKLLGEDGANSLKDYTDSLPYRRSVEELATRLSYSETPLSAAQSETLVQQMRQVAAANPYTRDLGSLDRREAGRVTAEEVGVYLDERIKRDTLVAHEAAKTLDADQLAALLERQLADLERDERRLAFMVENRGSFGGRGRDDR